MSPGVLTPGSVEANTQLIVFVGRGGSPGVLTPGSVEACSPAPPMRTGEPRLRGYLPPAPLKHKHCIRLDRPTERSPGVLTPGSVEACPPAPGASGGRASPGVLTPGSVEARDSVSDDHVPDRSPGVLTPGSVEAPEHRSHLRAGGDGLRGYLPPAPLKQRPTHDATPGPRVSGGTYPRLR